jgi:predicted GTPase
MGAAGRDFHNFNVCFRENTEYDVVAFTAAQIPGIARRIYPAILSGSAYPNGIPICPEDDLAKMIEDKRVEEVVLAYSDLSYSDVMHKASTALGCGADFRLMNPWVTMLKSKLPVVSICAVRTGAGKSTVTRKICSVAKNLGLRFSVVRHPMPYGELTKQVAQRFRTYEDLDRYDCTIEEREEYEPHIDAGNTVYAGVDYGKVLAEAENDVDMVVWDGGNNDLPFYEPTIHVVVTDPHRPGDELLYYPSEINVRMADAIIINKVDTARLSDVETVEKNVRSLNQKAEIFRANSSISVQNSELIKGKRVLVVEDGPTVTHGGMHSSAGAIAANKFGAREMVDPRPYAVGSIKRPFEKYPQLSNVLPAMGYNDSQINDLRETIRKVECDLVIVGTSINLKRLIGFAQPSVRVTYEIESPDFESWIKNRFKTLHG